MDGFLVDRDRRLTYLDAVDAKRRPAMGQGREQEHFTCGRDLAQRAVPGERGPRSIQYGNGRRGERAQSPHSVGVRLIRLIDHAAFSRYCMH